MGKDPQTATLHIRVTQADSRSLKIRAKGETIPFNVYLRRLLDIGLHTKYNSVLEPLKPVGRPRRAP